MISVIVATYGGKEWVKLAHERAVPSVLAQGHSVICVHHGTTIAQARNAAARQATCEWLCFLDADDELAPGFLGAMERALERQPALDGTPLLLTPAVQQIRKGRPKAPFFFPECDYRTGNWLIIGTLIQKRLFDEVGGFSEHPHGLEDWVLWAKAQKAGARVVKVKDAVYWAYVNPRSKHHVLARNRRAYMEAYHVAQAEVLA